MCTPFAMHWYISTSPDLISFSCFGCQKVGKFNCFTLACTNKPNIHLFCPSCAQYHDTRMNFSCPACLLRDEVDKCKEEAAEEIVTDAPLITFAHARERGIMSKNAVEKIENKMKNDEEEDYVAIDMENVKDEKK